MTPWSTYKVAKVPDDLPKGSLRALLSDGRWGISPPHDRWWANAFYAWHANGQFFDGTGWVAMSSFQIPAELRRHLEI